ncbi:hypothetical protein [Arthrobacter oryzae]|uniref:PepSY domain-containing protein n=1 Tax=Arthrobacter oryzae TaxID=409290 RepID=A0A495EF32_9MICC|nr:hypothetical protein [Arthrobacter oryzae]RKR15498.1 hypothetical protein C8D78_3019 [Arthrobacter oryzae]
MAQINKTTAGIMLAAVIGGGAIGASAIPAMAADGTGTSSSGTSSSGTAAPDGYGNGYGAPGGGQGGPHQANGKTEVVLTGDTATKVEAAVKAAQPAATIERMETDADGATYEAHITKADGTRATVLLDANFKVTGTQAGPGGGHGGLNDGDADDAAGGATSNG